MGDTPVARAVRDQRSILDRSSNSTYVWCAPLAHNGTAIGALELVTAPSRTPVATDLHALVLFAEPAADAIARVRVMDTERAHVEELLELDRMKRAYVSGIGHDLRTPLTSLRGATAALRRTENPGTQAELLDVIDRQVERLANLAQALIDAEHEQQADTLRLDLPGLVRLIALDGELAGRPVSVDAPEHLDVIADPEAIRRMLTNLIDNAYAHGAPPVSVAVETRSGYAVMTVTDCGGGVAIEERERIFEHAYRGSTHDRSGHGLGLAIVRSLAEACGGTAWVEPAADGGATFLVSLRMRDVTQQEAAWNLGRVS
jgi:two-component system sensor histidine kinase KdpD